MLDETLASADAAGTSRGLLRIVGGDGEQRRTADHSDKSAIGGPTPDRRLMARQTLTRQRFRISHDGWLARNFCQS